MMKFDVLNRFSGKVQFTAEIDCDEDTARSWKLRLAILWAIKTKTDLSDSDLRGSDLRGSNLRGSNLRDSDLSYSDLRGSNLRGSNLRGSNLRGSDLSYSDLRGSDGYITGPYRSDGYRFDVRMVSDKWAVVAGCRTNKNWTTDDYRDHAKDYDDEVKRAETLAILDYLDAMVALKGGAQ